MVRSRGVESLPTIKLYLRRIVCDKGLSWSQDMAQKRVPPFVRISLRKKYELMKRTMYQQIPFNSHRKMLFYDSLQS